MSPSLWENLSTPDLAASLNFPGTAHLKWKEPYMQSEVLGWDRPPPVRHLVAVRPQASYITSLIVCVLILERLEQANTIVTIKRKAH